MSDPSDRPSKRTRLRTGPRTLVACVNCKDRKLKCNDDGPACINCVRTGSSCLVEDPITKRRQPRNYLETLETRVSQLEAAIRETQDQASQAPHLQGTHSPQTPVIDADLAHPQSDASVYHEASSDLASKVASLGLNADGAEPHYLGLSSAFAFSRILSSSLLQAVPNEADGSSKRRHDDLEAQYPCFLPPHEIGMVLSNAYFDNIHPQYPFLHEATFRQWESDMTDPSRTAQPPDWKPRVFLYMVYAVGAMLLPQSGQSPERLYLSAQLYVDRVVSQDNLESVQALLCCAMYSLRSPTGPSVWKLTGLALRQCIELGFHRSSAHYRSTTDPMRLQLQRRVFWCAYSIDCATSMTLGRPLGIHSSEVDAEFPLDLDDADIIDDMGSLTTGTLAKGLPTSMSVAIHVFRIRYLWAKLHNSLYTNTQRKSFCSPGYDTLIESLRTELENWRASAPPLRPRQREALSLFASNDWFDTNYSYTILFLYRGKLTETGGSAEIQVFLECLKAAKTICHGYRRQFIGRSVGYTWGALHFLFLAGLTYLHCLWTSPAARALTRPEDVISTCTDCTMVLVVMAEKWEGATTYRDIFEALASKTMTMVVERRQADKSMHSTNTDPVDWNQWLSDMADSAISNDLDRLLAGFIGDAEPR